MVLQIVKLLDLCYKMNNHVNQHKDGTQDQVNYIKHDVNH